MRTIVTGALVALPDRDHTFCILRSRDHAFPIPRSRDHTFAHLPRHQPRLIFLWHRYLSGTWLQSSAMKCPSFGCYVAKGTRLPGWRLDQRGPTPRKGTSRISPSRVYGAGLPWTRVSDLYKEAISLLEAAQCGGEMPGLSDTTSWDCWW